MLGFDNEVTQAWAGLTGVTLSQNNEKIWVDFCLLPELSGGETKCYWLDPNFKSGSRFLGDESTLVFYGPNEKPIDAGV
jgi:hypothetical protein